MAGNLGCVQSYNQIEFTKDFILAKIAKGKMNGTKTLFSFGLA